jgi:hypothetical protein
MKYLKTLGTASFRHLHKLTFSGHPWSTYIWRIGFQKSETTQPIDGRSEADRPSPSIVWTDGGND